MPWHLLQFINEEDENYLIISDTKIYVIFYNNLGLVTLSRTE